MERKDLKVGMFVKPSGCGSTKHWKNPNVVGVVTRIGSVYIWVHWEDMENSDDEYYHYHKELRDANE